MVAIDVTPGTTFGMVPVELLQQVQLMKLQQQTFVTLSGNLVAAALPSGQRNHVNDQPWRSYSEYMKGIFLLTFLFSVLVLTVCFTNQF